MEMAPSDQTQYKADQTDLRKQAILGATSSPYDSGNSESSNTENSILFVHPEDVPERLYCVNCRQLMSSPFVIRTCGHNICNKCVLTLTENGSRKGICPGDGREKCNIGEFGKPDVQKDNGLKRDIQDLTVYCPHRMEGCQAEIPFGKLKRHLNGCIFARLSETGDPAMIDVIATLQQQIMSLQDEMRVVNEERDQCLRTINDLEQTVQTTTQKNKIYEKQMAKFLSNGIDTTQNGKFDDIVKDMNQLKIQAESQSLKLSTLETTVTETLTGGPTGPIKNMFRKVNEKVALHDVEISDHDIRLQCVENASHDGKLVWKIANLSDHMENAKSGKTLSLFSQPFYSDVRGYKMCGRVYLNGDGAGKGTHVSLYFVLMKGTYDDLLEWPFQHKITLGAIDVTSNGAKTVTESFKPNTESNSFKKPAAAMNVACGCPLFLSHKDLFSGPFIKDDTLYLTIDVEKK